jgi:hypothetical protein
MPTKWNISIENRPVKQHVKFTQTVKKVNGNQRRDRNFPLPLLENPVRGSEQK